MNQSLIEHSIYLLQYMLSKDSVLAYIFSSLYKKIINIIYNRILFIQYKDIGVEKNPAISAENHIFR